MHIDTPKTDEFLPRTRLAMASGDLTRVPLAARIVAYLREADLPSGAHVTERELVEAFGVSRTPIRKALAALSDHGLLTSKRNRGFFLNRRSTEFDPGEVEQRVAEASSLFNRIANDRLNGTLPDCIRAGDLASRYEIGRRRARQVLDELAEEGVAAPTRDGWRFSPALSSIQASADSYAFRAAVEPQIPLLPGFKVDLRQIQLSREDHLRFFNAPPNIRTARQGYKIDANFHEMIAEFGGNAFFMAVISQQNRLRQLLEYQSYADMPRVRAWCMEHMSILDALEAGDRPLASRLLAKHLANAAESARTNEAAA